MPPNRSNASPPQIVVVGAGPAGMAAARAAAMAGAHVTLLDHCADVGLRLLVTGGGRCNIANTASPEQTMEAFGRAGRHMQPALAAFGTEQLRGWLRHLGLGLCTPDGFHLYPEPASARVVRDAIRAELNALGVAIHTGAQATALCLHEGRCTAVHCAQGRRHPADAVVLATGGAARAKLGADGSGYALARGVGHSVRGPFPALVPLLATEGWCAELAGVSLEEVELRVEAAPLRRERWRGALLFTHRGVSGPAALNASGALSEALAATPSTTVVVRVNLVPARTPAHWTEFLQEGRARHGARQLPALLSGLLPASAASVLARSASLEGEPCARWTRTQQEALVGLLTGLPLTIHGTEGFGEAMLTRGGVALREVEPRTLGSRLVPNLFLAGELLDLDGPCGGYNLLWAFGSGHLAGASSAATPPR